MSVNPPSASSKVSLITEMAKTTALAVMTNPFNQLSYGGTTLTGALPSRIIYTCAAANIFNCAYKTASSHMESTSAILAASAAESLLTYHALQVNLLSTTNNKSYMTNLKSIVNMQRRTTMYQFGIHAKSICIANLFSVTGTQAAYKQFSQTLPNTLIVPATLGTYGLISTLTVQLPRMLMKGFPKTSKGAMIQTFWGFARDVIYGGMIYPSLIRPSGPDTPEGI